MSTTSNIIFKLSSQSGSISRFTLEYSSVQDLFEKLKKALESRSASLDQLCWIDEDQDYIQLSSLDDLTEAVNTSPSTIHLVPGKGPSNEEEPTGDQNEDQNEDDVDYIVIDDSDAESDSDEPMERRRRHRSRSHSRGRKERKLHKMRCHEKMRRCMAGPGPRFGRMAARREMGPGACPWKFGPRPPFWGPRGPHSHGPRHPVWGRRGPHFNGPPHPSWEPRGPHSHGPPHPFRGPHDRRSEDEFPEMPPFWPGSGRFGGGFGRRHGRFADHPFFGPFAQEEYHRGRD